MARRRLHFHLALVIVGDDEIRHRQPQARALADFLGSEEGLEGAFAHVLAHADAVVLDLDFRPRWVQSRTQDNPAGLAVVLALMDGLGSILEQVEQHLLQFVCGAGYRARFGSN